MRAVLLLLVTSLVGIKGVYVVGRISNYIPRGGARKDDPGAKKKSKDSKKKLTKSRRTSNKNEDGMSLQNIFAGVSRQTAAPFLRKTRENVKVASKTVVELKEKAAHAKDRFDLEQKCKDLERQAANRRKSAETLKLESDTIFDKRNKGLISPDSSLPSSEARRLLDSYLSLDKKVSGTAAPETHVIKEIKALEKEELEAKAKEWLVKDMERKVLAAQRNVEAARNAEQMALQRLDDARRNLVQATKNIDSCEQEKEDLESKEVIALTENEYAIGSLERQRERVRSGLLKKETESLQGEATLLKSEAELEEQEAKALEKEAQAQRHALEKMIAEHRKLGYCN